MTRRDAEVLKEAHDYLNGVKPKRIPAAMNRLARMARSRDLSDDCRMHLNVARWMLSKNGSALAAFAHITRVLGWRVRKDADD